MTPAINIAQGFCCIASSGAAPRELVLVAAGKPLSVLFGVQRLVKAPSFLLTMKISPVESLLMYSLPLLSHASPTGRKHPSGHFERSGLDIMSMAAEVLFLGSVGKPLANLITESLYPMGSERSLRLDVSITTTLNNINAYQEP